VIIRGDLSDQENVETVMREATEWSEIIQAYASTHRKTNEI